MYFATNIIKQSPLVSVSQTIINVRNQVARATGVVNQGISAQSVMKIGKKGIVHSVFL